MVSSVLTGGGVFPNALKCSIDKVKTFSLCLENVLKHKTQTRPAPRA